MIMSLSLVLTLVRRKKLTVNATRGSRDPADRGARVHDRAATIVSIDVRADPERLSRLGGMEG
jgi:hypothetical protein